MRARKSPEEKDRLAEFSTLQRGRACEGAEMQTELSILDAAIKLQRGRACEGAEIPGGEACRID